MQVKVLNHDLKIVASNIHTHEQFELCKEPGLLFQGLSCRPGDKIRIGQVQRHAVVELRPGQRPRSGRRRTG